MLKKPVKMNNDIKFTTRDKRIIPIINNIKKNNIMIYTVELNLTEFKFWAGAKQHSFSYNELKELECTIEDLYFDKTPTETDINDLFWFEEEYLCECLELDFEEYLDR